MTASEKIGLDSLGPLRFLSFGVILRHRYPSPPSKLISIGAFLVPEQPANNRMGKLQIPWSA
jgi:hypothetical protein